MDTQFPSVPQLNIDVSAVLQNQNQSPCKEYDVLLYHLAEPQTENELLTKYLRQLRDCVSLLSKEHEQLVGLLLKLNWLDRDVAIAREYKPLILNLVSAHPYYLRACLRMIVKKFFLEDLKKSSTCSKTVDDASRQLDQVRFTHVHELLKAVAQIVPSTKTVLMHLVRESFPYFTKDVYVHETFTSNLLHITRYIPELQLSIYELLVDKMLNLDVRAPRRDLQEEASSEEEDENEPTVFKMDGVDEEPQSESLTTENDQPKAMTHMEAMRLDIMMDLTMTHIHSLCYVKDDLQWDVTKQIYKELLSVFDKYILPTHASCHSQFLLFYICSLKQDLAVGFLDYLWKKVKNPMTQCVFRQAAAGYMGSFLARAVFIHINTVKETLKVLADWLHDYLDHAGSDSLHADLAHHAPFYAVCQALFYVFCFRSQQLLESNKGFKWAESLNLQRLVTSKLNPLRVCIPLTCTTFASVTRKYQLAFCDTVIQRNNRLKLTLSDTTLEAYFPFDPYLLKRSGRWIKPLYRKYEGVLPDAKKEDRDESDDDDDFAPEDDMEISLGTSGPSGSTSKLDFLQYGISPGFKL